MRRGDSRAIARGRAGFPSPGAPKPRSELSRRGGRAMQSEPVGGAPGRSSLRAHDATAGDAQDASARPPAGRGFARLQRDSSVDRRECRGRDRPPTFMSCPFCPSLRAQTHNSLGGVSASRAFPSLTEIKVARGRADGFSLREVRRREASRPFSLRTLHWRHISDWRSAMIFRALPRRRCASPSPFVQRR